MSAPTWDHYRSFLSVLQTGSLSAAARRLGLTQPTLARHVEQLEQALGGARLFTRSPQGLAPTDLALRLKPHAETMAAAAAAAERATEGEAGAMTGTVRISASDVIGAEVLPALLRELRARQPGLTFEIVLSNTTSDLLRREADIAIRMIRPTQSALVAKRVGTVELGFHAHPDYLARHGTPDTLDDLTAHTIIGFDRDSSATRGFETTGVTFDRARFAYRIDNQIAQLSAIRAACGIGICQTALGRRPPRLTHLFAEAFAVPLETWVTMHEDLRQDPRLRLTFDHLCETMAAYCADS
ncbi:LysR family transcriptional regulator [Psychromarinibacter sp. C21-152]|uniref:LysR family transcriptional regulator n=1 Tax=Psychromarinibacter sediminicola TaxID=3033385 RepID=A0AAE3TBJ2_9RHOB|nr:LysR family transcriptional regulator [Psychromarinibacter sediminicola]MDF0603923.1 LysR family transcriptional regulator [Psychromarinibacter sediminicola]